MLLVVVLLDYLFVVSLLVLKYFVLELELIVVVADISFGVVAVVAAFVAEQHVRLLVESFVHCSKTTEFKFEHNFRRSEIN